MQVFCSIKFTFLQYIFYLNFKIYIKNFAQSCVDDSILFNDVRGSSDSDLL
jgi:hypothetical protein